MCILAAADVIPKLNLESKVAGVPYVAIFEASVKAVPLVNKVLKL
jgi:hypothetical protein